MWNTPYSLKQSKECTFIFICTIVLHMILLATTWLHDYNHNNCHWICGKEPYWCQLCTFRLQDERYFLEFHVMPTNHLQCNFMTFPCETVLYIYLLFQRAEFYVTHTAVFCFSLTSKSKYNSWFSSTTRFCIHWIMQYIATTLMTLQSMTCSMHLKHLQTLMPHNHDCVLANCDSYVVFH